MTLQNYMEFLVEEALTQWIQSGENFCNCTQCHQDATAFALNQLPARYVVSSKGKGHVQMESLSIQFKTDLLSKTLEAIKVISQNPRHESKNSKPSQ